MEDDQTPIMANTPSYQVPPASPKLALHDLHSYDPRYMQQDAPVSLVQDPEEDAPYAVRMPTCLGNRSTMYFQCVMFAAFLLGLVLSIFSSYKHLAPGVIWGSVLSLFSVVFVILSYASVPAFRQHPNPILFWRTIADAIFVLQLLAQQFTRCLFFDCKDLCDDDHWQCGCATPEDSANNTCNGFAAVFEFSLIASEAWFCCMTLNLVLSLTNPFTDFKRNTRMFHIFCWGLGIFLGLLLISKGDWAGYSDMEICWTNALRNINGHVDPVSCPANPQVFDALKVSYKASRANLVTWGFFYMWLGAIILYGIVVWIWAWKRLSEGMPETYAIRIQSINRTRFNVLAVLVYWVIFVAVYIPFLNRKLRPEHEKYYQVPKYLLAGKGYVDFIIWFSLNEFNISQFTRWWRADAEASDVDLSPQVNAALRKEVLFYTTSGIVKAVRAAERLPASQKDQTLALLPQSQNNGRSIETQDSEDAVFDENQRVAKNAERSKTFHDYEPHAFKRIRERFGVTKEAYIHSISATAKERLSEGASGAFMFFSADSSLIVKSTSKEECTFLRSIAQRYADYLCSNPKSLLTRFYGCHCLELYGKQFSFVVMSNLFDTDQVIHSRYDIKGSWVNRHADLPKRGKKVTCRHCNSKFIYQNSSRENANCPNRLGDHEPNVVLKDMDLTQKLRLDRDVARELYDQLCADSSFLCSLGILDYSLLMGVNEVEYVVDEATEEEEMAQPRVNDTNMASSNPFKDRLMADSRGPPMSASNGQNRHFSVSSAASNPVKVSRMHDAVGRDVRAFSNASGRRLPRDGMRLANTVVGPAYYHLGIIDILQTWTLNKRMERFFKVTFKGVDGAGLSAIPPEPYKKRFQVKMADILDVEDMVTQDRMDIFAQQTSHMDVDTTRSSRVTSHSMRRLPTNDHHLLPSQSSMEYADARVSTQHLRHRSMELSASSKSQSVGQDTDEYQGIDYHL